MAIKPIPNKLLIHTATYEEFIDGDNFETEDSFQDPVTLFNILIQPASSFSRSSTSEALNYQSVLFFDVENSSSSGTFQFKERSKVTFEGKTMTVYRVNPIYALKLHHYEVGLQ